MGSFVGGISCHKRRSVRMNVDRYELRRSVLRDEIPGGRLCTSTANALWDDSQRRSQQVERPVAVEVAKFCCCFVRVRLIVCLEAVVWFLLPLLAVGQAGATRSADAERGGEWESEEREQRHGCTKHRPLRTTTSIRKYLRGAKFVYFHIGQFLRVTGR